MILGPAAVKKCGMIQSHATAFEEVAKAHSVVLATRELNPLCESLLKEGHASKGFYIKAKSCDWGPMAGMVLVDPRFTKERNTAKQQKYVNMALANGAGQHDVIISSSRLMELTSQGLVSQDSKTGGMQATEVGLTATSSHGGTVKFKAKRVGNVEPVWQIFECVSSGQDKPVKGLTNKPVPAAGRQPVGAKSVVAGDYDLFCVWARAYNKRPLPCGPNVMHGSQRAKAYVKAVKAAQGCHGEEDSDMGNVSFHSAIVIRHLNGAINAKSGYSGGNMVHHNDESGNPFTPGEDYPLLFFIPGQPARAVTNPHELTATYKECEALGFAVEKNPGFYLKKALAKKKAKAAARFASFA